MTMDEEKTTEFKLRPMKCEMNYLSKSDGSAILSQGATVALVSVNGPLDIKMSSQSIEKATLDIQYSTKGGKPSIADRYKENTLKQTCETAVLGCLYPRTGLNIVVQELEDDGGLLACCVNAVCLALMNSGVAMKYAFAAVSCCISADGETVLDPSADQQANCLAKMTFVFDSRDRNLITAVTSGSFTRAAYAAAAARARAAAGPVLRYYRDAAARYARVLG